jgi:hypothetical protein
MHLMEDINFKVVQGDTFTFEVIYQNPNGSLIDLTGYTAKVDVRDRPAGKILCASVTNSSGIIISGLEGKIVVTFTPEQTRKFTVPNASYQLQIIAPNTQRTTILKGNIIVSAATIR